MATKKSSKPTKKALEAKIADLEKKMFEFARELEFEKAASVRDDIETLRKQVVAVS